MVHRRCAGCGGGSVSVPARLADHLRCWLGDWPPGRELAVVANPANSRPGWDGSVHPLTGVVDAAGRAVVGVPPEHADAVQDALASGRVRDLPALRAAPPDLLERPGHLVYRGAFRWSTEPAQLPDVGVWVDADADVVPGWLRPFGAKVLLALDDDGRYLAGVGVKRHDAAGHELSVGTEPEARGLGLARRLVAQAARHVLAHSAVPTYLHAPDNLASARVAEAAGFPDRGWSVLGLFDARTGPDGGDG
ncbi:MAG: GNAT family N-acetyltransferase [Actinomycetes bacterium]